MVTRFTHYPLDALQQLMDRYGLSVAMIESGTPIPGSFWGGEEAGLIESTLYVRPDTPIHSALHEACHWICMDNTRRSTVHTDAGGDDLEESGVCFLQILLADHLPELGRERLMRDMDEWGYSFRLGSTRAWFEQDAEDALEWLSKEGLVNESGEARIGKVRA